jgi:pyruvate ferredoxin oxidoreductase gamma subunit/2-oxoisovalerate ferredoxin oxidoreductase gamma subunit
MIGAFSRVLGMPPMGAIAAAIHEEVPREAEKNVRAAREAYKEVRLIGLIEEKGVKRVRAQKR